MDIINADPNPPKIEYKKPVTMGARGVVHIPEAARTRLKLEHGDMFIVSIENHRIVLTPATVIPNPDADKAADHISVEQPEKEA